MSICCIKLHLTFYDHYNFNNYQFLGKGFLRIEDVYDTFQTVAGGIFYYFLVRMLCSIFLILYSAHFPTSTINQIFAEVKALQFFKIEGGV